MRTTHAAAAFTDGSRSSAATLMAESVARVEVDVYSDVV